MKPSRAEDSDSQAQTFREEMRRQGRFCMVRRGTLLSSADAYDSCLQSTFLSEARVGFHCVLVHLRFCSQVSFRAE